MVLKHFVVIGMVVVSFTQAKSIKHVQKEPLMKDLSHASLSSPIAEIESTLQSKANA